VLRPWPVPETVLVPQGGVMSWKKLTGRDTLLG
jgi:hypothetical protein